MRHERLLSVKGWALMVSLRFGPDRRVGVSCLIHTSLDDLHCCLYHVHVNSKSNDCSRADLALLLPISLSRLERERLRSRYQYD